MNVCVCIRVSYLWGRTDVGKHRQRCREVGRSTRIETKKYKYLFLKHTQAGPHKSLRRIINDHDQNTESG